MLLPPALILIVGALSFPLLDRRLREIVILALPILTLVQIWSIPTNYTLEIHLAGFTLVPVLVHAFTPIFATIFCLATFAGALFGYKHMKPLEMTAAFIYAGGAIGVTFSGDLLSLFIYWEIMAIASTLVVWCGKWPETNHAGMRYAFMHFLGGVILLCGIASHITDTGQTTLVSLLLADRQSLAFWLILTGVLINAAAPPFSAWIADAYPASSPFGAVFLSAFTTKTSVFVLLTLFAGTPELIVIGLFMVFYGIIYAMLENNIRRILSYSIVNQVGFMVTGIGIGTELALYGVATHAFCHIIYKALLFMSAGSVIYMTGKRKASELGGLYRTMKVTTWCGIIGALSISAFPLTSGFVSKSIINDAAHDFHIVWLALTAASAGVFLHAGIKYPWFVFFQKDSGLRPEDPPKNMQWAMLLLVFGCLAPALFPAQLYALLPGEVNYAAYTAKHIITQLQLLMFSALAFFLMLPFLKRTLTITLDFDWFYRVFAMEVLYLFEWIANHILMALAQLRHRVLGTMFQLVFKLHGPEGIAARNWGIGATVLTTTALLALFLILYYV